MKKVYIYIRYKYVIRYTYISLYVIRSSDVLKLNLRGSLLDIPVCTQCTHVYPFVWLSLIVQYLHLIVKINLEFVVGKSVTYRCINVSPGSYRIYWEISWNNLAILKETERDTHSPVYTYIIYNITLSYISLYTNPYIIQYCATQNMSCQVHSGVYYPLLTCWGFHVCLLTTYDGLHNKYWQYCRERNTNTEYRVIVYL